MRILFEKGEQQKFMEKILSKISVTKAAKLCNLSERYLKVAKRLSFAGPAEKFSWIFDREV